MKVTVIDKPLEAVRIRALNIWQTVSFSTRREDEGLILAYLNCVLNCLTDSVTCAKFRTTILTLSISVTLIFYACTLNVIRHGFSVSTFTIIVSQQNQNIQLVRLRRLLFYGIAH